VSEQVRETQTIEQLSALKEKYKDNEGLKSVFVSREVELVTRQILDGNFLADARNVFFFRRN